MPGGDFTITSADNGSAVPADGIAPGGKFIISISGGSTISATLQKKYSDGTYRDIPSADNKEVIDGEYDKMVFANHGDEFKINVTTATGTWYVSQRPVR